MALISCTHTRLLLSPSFSLSLSVPLSFVLFYLGTSCNSLVFATDRDNREARRAVLE